MVDAINMRPDIIFILLVTLVMSQLKEVAVTMKSCRLGGIHQGKGVREIIKSSAFPHVLFLTELWGNASLHIWVGHKIAVFDKTCYTEGELVDPPKVDRKCILFTCWCVPNFSSNFAVKFTVVSEKNVVKRRTSGLRILWKHRLCE